MKGIEPSLLEKLLDDAPRNQVPSGVFKSSCIAQYKESVARDLEGLLNSKAAFAEDDLGAYPECRTSLFTYGLKDFSGKSLANAYDRAAICRSLEQAIARHEPRLLNVRVAISPGQRQASALHFVIHALLNLHPAREPISFDALLQTSTNTYSIKRQARLAETG